MCSRANPCLPAYYCISDLYFVSVILCFINCMSIKWAEQIQVSMTVVKLVAAGIIMAGGFYSLAEGIYYYKHII